MKRTIMVFGATLGALFFWFWEAGRQRDIRETPSSERSFGGSDEPKGAFPETVEGMREGLYVQASSGLTESGEPEQGSRRGQESPSMKDRLKDLQAMIETPVVGVDLEIGLREKYGDLSPQELLEIYPYLLEVHDREMRATLARAIEAGDYSLEYVSAGQPVDLDRYRQPGSTFMTVASQSQPLGNGLVEYRIVSIEPGRFPEMYARDYENNWVHEKLDEAGICKACSSPPPANVRVSLSSH